LCGVPQQGWDRERARMADSSARNGHASDVPPSPSSCVCTARLPLKMQARPATPGSKDDPGRVYTVCTGLRRGAAAPTSPTSPRSLRRLVQQRPMQRTRAALRGNLSGKRMQLGGNISHIAKRNRFKALSELKATMSRKVSFLASAARRGGTPVAAGLAGAAAARVRRGELLPVAAVRRRLIARGG